MSGGGPPPAAVARNVLRRAATAALATLGRQGGPFASLVSVATTPAGEPILLLSALAAHTANLERDPRAALLLAPPADGDPLAGPRLTLAGAVSAATTDPMLRRRFLARHPEASGYAGFADFGFRRFVPESAHLVAGFGRVVDLAPEDLLLDVAGCAPLLAAEAGAVAHMNEDHADALRLYATRLLGLPDGDWRATGVDPAGLDLRAGDRTARLDFPETAATPQALRATLVALAAKARQIGA